MDLYRREEKVRRIKKKLKVECRKCFNILEDFERHLRLNSYSIGRIEKYWCFLRTIHKLLGKCFQQADKKDMEDFVLKVDSNPKWSEWTKADFKRILKFFYRWLRKTEDYPEEVKWIKVRLKRNNEKAPEQILTREEVELIASKARNLMERAFVLCLYESACRIGEFLNIRIKDIQFDRMDVLFWFQVKLAGEGLEQSITQRIC